MLSAPNVQFVFTRAEVSARGPPAFSPHPTCQLRAFPPRSTSTKTVAGPPRSCSRYCRGSTDLQEIDQYKDKNAIRDGMGYETDTTPPPSDTLTPTNKLNPYN